MSKEMWKQNTKNERDLYKSLLEDSLIESLDKQSKSLKDTFHGLEDLARDNASGSGDQGSRLLAELKAFLKLPKDEDLSKIADNALETFSFNATMESWIQALKDESWMIRRIAAQKLGNINIKTICNKKDFNRLIDCLIDTLSDKNEQVQKAVLEALKNLETEKTKNAIKKYMSSKKKTN